MGFFDGLRDAFAPFDSRSIIDIALIAALIYGALLLLRNTTAMSVLRGIGFVLIVVFIMARALDLVVLNWLLDRSFTGLIIAVPIIFQPEIRRTLERVGRTGLGGWLSRPAYEDVVEVVAESCASLAARGYGALIVIERTTGLQDYIDTGVRIDASLSNELIGGLFYPNSPLHDGAAIIRENRVVAAGCTLPLSEKAVPRNAGTRHRAALGIADRTDAVAIVVSEETSAISIAMDGRLVTGIDDARLRALLHNLLGTIDGGDDTGLRALDSRSRKSAAS